MQQQHCCGAADTMQLTGVFVVMQSVLALSECLALRHLNVGHNQLPSVAGLEGAGPGHVLRHEVRAACVPYLHTIFAFAHSHSAACHHGKHSQHPALKFVPTAAELLRPSEVKPMREAQACNVAIARAGVFKLETLLLEQNNISSAQVHDSKTVWNDAWEMSVG